jgi:hypothetical protein
MSFSASSAHSDERVLDVQFTEDAISVSLRDGRVITVPLVWYPRGCSTPQPRSARTGKLPAVAAEFIGPTSTKI